MEPGHTVISPVRVVVLLPAALATVNVTVYVPAARYLCSGFSNGEPPPSPKSHDHDVGEPVDVSVNCTSSGPYPDVGEAVSEAVGVTGVVLVSTVRYVASAATHWS
jgi:hypothetical protein